MSPSIVWRDSGMDSPASVKAAGQAAATPYRVYRRRWAMVATVMLLNISNSGLGFNLAAVAYKAADYFEVAPQQVTWFTQVYFLVPIVCAPISTFIFNKFGLRAGIHVGSALNSVAAVTRALATSGLVADPWVQYAVSLSGQVAGGMGELFLAFVSTKVAQNWFPDDSRMIATTIMAFSPPFGILVAQVMAPLVVKKQQQIPTLNYAYCGLSLLAELVALVCVTRSQPPTPPSRSAEQGHTARAPYLQQLKNTFTCLPFLGLLLTGGILAAIYLCFTTLSQQMLCATGYSDLFSGALVATFTAAGFVGSLIMVTVANRTGALTSTIKLVDGLAVVFIIFLMEVYLVPGQHALLIFSAIPFGIFNCGGYPLLLEMGVEATYPVEETISTTLIYLAGQVLGLIIIYISTVVSGDLPPQLQHVEVCTAGLTSDLQARDYSGFLTGLMPVLSIIIILFIIFFRTPYKRREAEKLNHAAPTARP